MAKIKLRRDTAANWALSNPVLAQGEPGFEHDTGKLKLGDGVAAWNSLAYIVDFSSVSQDIIPDTDNTRSLGSPTRQWKEMYVANGSIYIGNVKLSNNSGKLEVVKVINPGEVNEAPDPDDSDAVSALTSQLTNGVNSFALTEQGTLTLNGAPYGLPTVVIPGEQGSVYKGLQVSYGVVHSNGSSNECNVNKIVIHKPAVVTLDIDPTGNQDYFRVSGLENSDVLAMFVLYGDINGPKPLSELQAFAEAAIDNVILDGGVEGQYNTVDLMKANFYTNYQTLATAAGGLYANFVFYETYISATTGITTVREGSGATFDVTGVSGTPLEYVVAVASGGTNYLPGHKIRILGSALSGIGVDGVHDLTITVLTVGPGGSINSVSWSGEAAELVFAGAVAGTNYQVGSGFVVAGAGLNPGQPLYINVNSQGSGYVVGDVLTLLGSDLLGGTSPSNDITITITAVDGSGIPQGWNVSGTFPNVWPTNSISDGGEDQYDTANYINSFYAANINYEQGQTVTDGTTEFGAGSSYSFVYENSIFGLFVTGNDSSFISTSGNSGADGNSTTETGNIYGPDTVSQTFDNAVTHINLVGDTWAGPIVSFTRPDNSDQTIDILIPDDGEGAGVAIARDSNASGIFNPYRESGWNSNVSPAGTLWNTDGWTDLSDVESRTYQNLYAAFGSGGLGNKIVGTECVMYLPDNGKYYAVKFDSWTQGGNGGGFSYTRREIDLNNLQEGIRFADGTRLKSAEGLGRVKSTASGNRRIEEVVGSNTVSVTAVENTVITFTASRTEVGSQWFWLDNTTTTIDDIINNYPTYGVINIADMEFSVDGVTYYPWNGSGTGSGNENAYSVFPNSISYNQGDTLYFRYKHGGQPVIWWDRNDLPSGGANFRGAVINYHAYTGEATWIGTIHIVDDSGEQHISHTEVGSGTSDSENDDLWLVENEGTISYRRIDGEAKTLKIHWTAKVFYGSEFYD